MTTTMKVLKNEELSQVHEVSLHLLAGTGIRVDTLRGRKILASAGAEVSESSHIVKFPQRLVEDCLRQVPRRLELGGRRRGWSLPLAQHPCSLIMDGGAVHTWDAVKNERRSANREDWLLATRLSETLDEFGCYWNAVSGVFDETPAGLVEYWSSIFRNFSKHIQEATYTADQTRWLLEVLEVVYGGRQMVQKTKPISFLVCPTSPLVLDEHHTDAYLETVGWGIPLAVMTMPLLGLSGPGTLISNLVLANSETLGMLCLAQAAEPGTGFIYAPIPALADPHNGRFGSGGVEQSLLGAAVVEMARFYDLPVENSTGGSDHHIPGIQAGYERALNFILPVMAQPDLLVGPGLLGGAMIFSPEQVVIDLEIYHRCLRLVKGMDTSPGKWLSEVIETVGPGGNFMNQVSTRQSYHNGEIYISQLGCHEPFERWQMEPGGDILQEAREKINHILAHFTEPAFDETIEKELGKIGRKARQAAEK